MSDDIILKVENLSKQYRLGNVGTGTLAHDLNRTWAKLRGKEDPYLTIGAVNDRSAQATSDYVWALQDINFEVKRGEILGIIGKNGAGKSTLLKILSRVTSPTTGSIKVGGRMASLLEVGTGMHPELTGRENIYLNGAILGMTKAEIASKIDEIVAFSGCEMYIDTPVKRYSSGMGVRLGFAVAAFLEPDILVVDEVLAVGDAEFQKKAIGKMQDISSQGGRTVLVVSHNMGTINELCDRCILLENGLIKFDGDVASAVSNYLEINNDTLEASYTNYDPLENADILSVKVLQMEKLCSNFAFSDSVRIQFELLIDDKLLGGFLGFNVKDGKDRTVFTSEYSLEEIKSGLHSLQVDIPSSILVPNNYILTVAYHIPNVKIIRLLENVVSFVIEETGSTFYKYGKFDYGCVIIQCKWNLNTTM